MAFLDVKLSRTIFTKQQLCEDLEFKLVDKSDGSNDTSNSSSGASAQPDEFRRLPDGSMELISVNEKNSQLQNTDKTIVRGYDISLEQFNHVLVQENGGGTNLNVTPLTNAEIQSFVDREPGIVKSMVTHPDNSKVANFSKNPGIKTAWYGLVLYLGLLHIKTVETKTELEYITKLPPGADRNEYLPLFTITGEKEEISNLQQNPPSQKYVDVMKTGLKELKIPENEVNEYMDRRASKTGITK